MAQPAALKGRYRAGVWNRFLVANVTSRAALPWTALFVRLGLSPNQVSLLNFAASCAGVAVLLAAPFPAHRAVAAILLVLSLVWDHSDGQVARQTGKGSVLGGLVDSILDRFVEASWIIAVGIDAHLHPDRGWVAWPSLGLLVLTGGAVFAQLYVRWAIALKNLAPLHQALKRAHRTAEGGVLRLDLGPHIPPRELGRTAGIPFYFNRDVTLWMLAVCVVLPDPAFGLAGFTLAHLMRGFELNWYTRNHLKDDGRAIWKLLDPDYH